MENWEYVPLSSPPSNILDKWILSRLNTTILKVTKSLDKFNTSSVAHDIESFVNDLSTWYIRRSRDRSDNFELLAHCFDSISRLTAPFVPFLSEIIFQNLHKNKSVHLETWPKVNNSQINPDLEDKMELVRKNCQDIHALRQKAGLKVRQPLASATIVDKLSEELLNVIKEETNVKNVFSGPELKIDTNLTTELIAECEYRDLVRAIQVIRKESGFKVDDKIKIFAPSWPKDFENEILKKTLGISIEKADTLHVEK
jgi:isoleucyl-tRNA synthetase